MDVRAVIDEFSRLLSVPTTAADEEGLRACAALICEMLAARGFAARLVTKEGAAPLVIGVLDVGADRTLALYSHYDGQPVGQPNWANDPWTPTLYDGVLESGAARVDPGSVGDWSARDYRLYARCTSDDKAPTQALCSALDLLRGRPSVNLLYVCEGEEECGSPNFQDLLEQVPEAEIVFGWLILDGPIHQSRRRQVVFGARGVVTLQLTVYGPTRTLHSGHYGNWVPNPAMRLVHLLASMRDERGFVAVPGVGERVLELTEGERTAIAAMPPTDAGLLSSLGVYNPEDGESGLVEATMRPAINLHGISAGHVQREATNAIMQRAQASMDIRLVPDQTIAEVREAITRHIGSQGYLVVKEEPDIETLRSHPRVVRLAWGSGYGPARTPLDSPFAGSLVAALGPDIVVNPMLGGSVPIRRLLSESDKPVAILPIANHDNNQHGANENIRVCDLLHGIELYSRVLTGL